MIDHSLKLLNSKAGLYKADQIRDSVREDSGLNVTRQYVSAVLSDDIGARYKRIRKVPWLGNTIRCLLLRQSYAKFILEQLASGTRVINVDQTWISDSNYQRRKWRKRGSLNT